MRQTILVCVAAALVMMGCAGGDRTPQEAPLGYSNAAARYSYAAFESGSYCHLRPGRRASAYARSAPASGETGMRGVTSASQGPCAMQGKDCKTREWKAWEAHWAPWLVNGANRAPKR